MSTPGRILAAIALAVGLFWMSGAAGAAGTAAALVPRLSIDDVRAAEGNGGQTKFTFTVTLSEASTERVRVNYNTVDGSGIGTGVDYWPASGTLFFEPGLVAASLLVFVIADTVDEPDENFFVRLSFPNGATIADNLGQGVIVNDDAPSIRLIEPNGGEILYVGDPTWIRWRAEGAPDSLIFVTLLLSLDGGVRYDHVIAAGLPNTGAFLWDSVAFTTGGEDGPAFSGVIKVEGSVPRGRTAADVGDAPFAIHDDPARTVTSTSMGIEPSAPTCFGGARWTASVSPAGATGFVDFLDGAIALGSVALDPDGRAEFLVARLDPGAQDLMAMYRGDASHRSSRSRAVVIVERAPTHAVLDTSASLACSEVRLTLELSAADATGAVRFYDGPILLGEAAVSQGRANWVASGVQRGPHDLSAFYMGDGCFLSAASETLVIETPRLASTVVLSSSANPASTGDPLVISAEVGPIGAAGEVEFLDAGTLLGRAPLVNGVARLSTALDLVGEHSITARYSGDACRLPGESQLVQRITATPEISIADSSTPEGNCLTHWLTFLVRLTSASSRVVTARYRTSDGTATAEEDYSSVSGQIRFAPGVTSQTIQVRVLEDLRHETNENLHVILFEPTVAVIGDSLGEGTLLEDDPRDEPPPELLRVWGSQGSGAGQFFNPFRAMVRENSELWVGEISNARIQIFNLRGDLKRIWPGNVGAIVGIGFDSSHVFTGAGSLITKWSLSGERLETWDVVDPIRDLAVDSQGNVYLVHAAGFVRRFDNHGNFQLEWHVSTPWGLTIDRNDHVYVGVPGAVYKYPRDGGSAIAVFNRTCIDRPWGLSTDAVGNLYVADAVRHRIQKFGPDGGLLAMWGTPGSEPGQFDGPTDVATDATGSVYVVDKEQHRVQRFVLPDRFPPILFCVGDTTVTCGPSGVLVDLGFHAEDDRDPSPRIECIPASGSLFPPGTTRVDCRATDRDGNSDSCQFEVTVRSDPCGEKSLVRIDEVGLACANGDSTAQFIELIATGEGQQFTGGLLLRIHDRHGDVVFERANLFATRPEGESWPSGRRWLIGSDSLSAAALAADHVIPPLLDVGGRIAILAPTSNGYEVIHDIGYGTQGGFPSPLPGRSLQRQDDGTMIEKTAPDPTRFDGAVIRMQCPCPADTIYYCGGRTVSTEPSASGQGRCDAVGGSSGQYDLRTGSFRASGGGSCVIHSSGGSARVHTNDVYWITGTPGGTPVPLTVELRLQLSGSSCSLGGYGYASGSLTTGGVVRSAASASLDTTLRVSMTVPAGRAFAISTICSGGGGAGGFGLATGQLSFSGLPGGARVASCQGFGGDVLVPVLASLEHASAEPASVTLRWHIAVALDELRIERADEPNSWLLVHEAEPDGEGRLVYQDRNVTAGSRYGYRLAWRYEGADQWSEPIWVMVPVGGLVLEPPNPNPSSGDIGLRFRLEGGLPSRITMIDVAGRRVFVRGLEGYAAGEHELTIPSSLRLEPGLYFVRITEGAQQRTARVLIMR